MASRNKAVALAAALLTKDNIAITERVINEDMQKAMVTKDVARVRALSELLAIVDEVKSEA